MYYERSIGDLDLEGAGIGIAIDEDENIDSVNARLVPASPELYSAVKRPTITEEDVRKIIENDRKAEGKKITISKSWKTALPNPPYVIWTAISHWSYTINAFTGEIIDKRPTWIE